LAVLLSLSRIADESINNRFSGYQRTPKQQAAGDANLNQPLSPLHQMVVF
jgi:hypothetical protein